MKKVFSIIALGVMTLSLSSFSGSVKNNLIIEEVTSVNCWYAASVASAMCGGSFEVFAAVYDACYEM